MPKEKTRNISPKRNANILEQGRIPPQAVDLEEMVLGAIMLEKNALTVVISFLRQEMFYKEAHQIIYGAIIQLFSKSEPVDISTVVNQLKSDGNLELIGGAYYITQLTNRVASSSNTEYHARIIVEKWIKREHIRIGAEMTKGGFEDTVDCFDAQEDAESALMKLSDQYSRGEAETMLEILGEVMKDINEASKSDNPITGIPSGIHLLDSITSGWQKTDLILLASRPGMGKTACALSAAKAAAACGKKSVIFSIEMSSKQLVTRLLAGEASITNENLRRGSLRPEDWERINSSVRKLEDLPIYIDDTAALNMFELRAKARRMKMEYDIDLIFLDFVQLMDGDGENREAQVALISRSMKAIAKELNIPFIAISQLNRGPEQRGGDKKPLLSDLRESGSLEQSADIVLFLWRPTYYKIIDYRDADGNLVSDTYAEIIIAKHRNGRLGIVPVEFIGKYTSFKDYDMPVYDPDTDVSDDELEEKPF